MLHLFARQFTKARLWALFAVWLSSVWLLGCGGNSVNAAGKGGGQGPPPAPAVTVAVAEQQPVPIELHAIGNAQPYRAVQLKSMVDGQISRVLLHQG